MPDKFLNRKNSYDDNEVARNLNPEHKKIWDEMFVCLDEIQRIIDRSTILTGNSLHYFFSASVAAYLLTKTFDYDSPSSVSFTDLENSTVDPTILDFAKKARIDDNWNELRCLTLRHQKNIFILICLLEVQSSGEQLLPTSVADISASLLDVQDGESFASLCCGTGYIIKRIKDSVSGAFLYGFDKNTDALALAKIWTEYSDSNNTINWEKCDIFDLNEQGGISRIYDKIYANYPLGIRVKDPNMKKEYYENALMKIPAFSKATSSDWLFALKIMDILADSGKAVCIMTNGSTWNRLDTPIRQYFVENGFVECVIALPSKLSAVWSIPISLVVLSHGNQGVRLVDASEQFEAERRINTISEENIENILAYTQHDSSESIFVSLDLLRENEYVLNAGRYIHCDEKVKDGIVFDNLITRITRGAQLKAEELDDISSQTPTDMRYLMLSNIQNGLIDKELPYLSRIDGKYEKYCLKKRCLILSKNGKPYKVAVAEHEDGKKVLANGNLFIIEVNEEVSDPYYIAAYFSSDLGIAALNSITVGATIPNIGIESLKKLIIPLPPLEIQHQIAERYKTARDEIALLQLKLEKAKDRMAKAFIEEE